MGLPLLLNLMHLFSKLLFLFPFCISRQDSALCPLQNRIKNGLRNICSGTVTFTPSWQMGRVFPSSCACTSSTELVRNTHPPSQEAAARRGAAKRWGGKAERKKREPNAVTLALGHHLCDHSALCLGLVQISVCYHGGILHRGFFWDQALDLAEGLCFLSPVNAQLHLRQCQMSRSTENLPIKT